MTDGAAIETGLAAGSTPAGPIVAAEASDRNGYSNLLRVLAACGVVCAHIATYTAFWDPRPQDPKWLFTVYFGLIWLWSLPCFVMISGDMYAARDEARFVPSRWLRRMRRIVFLTVVASLFFVLLSWLVIGNIHDIGIIAAVLGGPPFEHLWYMYFIIGLYALAPWLMRILKLIPGPVFWIALALLFLASAYGSLPGQPLVMKIPVGLCIGSYFLIGAQMRKWDRPNAGEICFWICAFILSVVTMGLIGTWMVQHYGIFQALTSAGSIGGPGAAITAMAVLRVARVAPVPMWIARIAPATFLIYIVHPIWVLILKHFWLMGTWHDFFLRMPFICLVVIIASTLTALALRWVKQRSLALIPVLRHVPAIRH